MKNQIVVLGIKMIFLFPILFLLSCSSSDQKSTDNESAHKVDTVVIQQMQFMPAQVKANVGDTIVWINKDMVDHDVTAQKSNSFYSDTIAVGNSWKMAVTDSAAYRCSIHPSMIGQILIK